MDPKRTAAIFSIVVGLAILGMWVAFYATKQIPELTSAPTAAYLHLAAEFVTAIALIAGGYGLLTGEHWAQPIHLVSLGMLLYSVIQAAGYFAQQGQSVFIALFAILAVAAVALIGLALQRPRASVSRASSKKPVRGRRSKR